jgi:hypothetical protein
MGPLHIVTAAQPDPADAAAIVDQGKAAYTPVRTEASTAESPLLGAAASGGCRSPDAISSGCRQARLIPIHHQYLGGCCSYERDPQRRGVVGRALANWRGRVAPGGGLKPEYLRRLQEGLGVGHDQSGSYHGGNSTHQRCTDHDPVLVMTQYWL